MTEQEQILNILEAGKITVDEASELLSVVGPNETVLKENRPSSRAKKIRIVVDSNRANGKKIDLNLDLPLGLAKFATKFIGKDKLVDIEGEGIDINEIMKTINETIETINELEEGTTFEKEVVINKKGAESIIKIEVI